MVGDVLVSKSTAMRNEKGDSNGGFGTGLNGKKISSFAPLELLQEGKILKSEKILNENEKQKPVQRRNGKSKRLNGKSAISASEADLPQGSTVVFKRPPLLEGLKNFFKGEDSAGIVEYSAKAPVQWQEVFNLAKYTYYNWLSSKEPSNADAKLAVEEYKPYFRLRAMEFLEQGGEEKRKAAMFMFEAKSLSIGIARKLIRCREGIITEVASLDHDTAEAASKLDMAEAEEKAKAREAYANKSTFLAEWIAKKFVPYEKYLQVAGPIGIGAAAFITGASPAIVGGVTAGAWLLFKGFKLALDWHLGMVKSMIPKREAAAMERITIDFNMRRGSLEFDFKQEKKKLDGKFVEFEEKMAQRAQEGYHLLLDKFGYLPAG